MRRDDAGLCAQIFDAKIGPLPAGVPVKAARLPQHRAGAALDRFGDVSAAVAAFTRAGNEHVALQHAPAVGRERSHRNAERAETCRIERRTRHTSSRGIWPSSLPRPLRPTGRSDLIDSMRSAPDMTVENTGAATSPP